MTSTIKLNYTDEQILYGHNKLDLGNTIFNLYVNNKCIAATYCGDETFSLDISPDELPDFNTISIFIMDEFIIPENTNYYSMNVLWKTDLNEYTYNTTDINKAIEHCTNGRDILTVKYSDDMKYLKLIDDAGNEINVDNSVKVSDKKIIGSKFKLFEFKFNFDII